MRLQPITDLLAGVREGMTLNAKKHLASRYAAFTPTWTTDESPSFQSRQLVGLVAMASTDGYLGANHARVRRLPQAHAARAAGAALLCAGALALHLPAFYVVLGAALPSLLFAAWGSFVLALSDLSGGLVAARRVAVDLMREVYGVAPAHVCEDCQAGHQDAAPPTEPAPPPAPSV